MAEGLDRGRQLVNAVDDRAAEQSWRGPLGIARRRSARAPSSPYSHKFLIATLTLAVVAIAGIAVAVAVLINHGKAGPQAAWSQFSPADSGLAGERDIANEVAPYYRASPAAQLDVVTVRNLNDNGSSTEIAVRDPTSGTLSALSGNSAVYTLCGFGPNCAINVGTPSANRLLLLRREALELSLYTFKYISNVDNVVAILPPGETQATAHLTSKPPTPGKTAGTTPVDLAVVFQRQGLSHFLSQPLRTTLPEQIPPTVDQMSSAPEAELVSVLTGQALFTQQMIQGEDGSNILVLSQAPAQ